MKKKIAPLGFLLCTTLLAAGCSKGDVKVVTEDGNYVIYSITVNGKKESFTADDLLAEMADSTVATTRIYNEIARKVFAIAADKRLLLQRMKLMKLKELLMIKLQTLEIMFKQKQKNKELIMILI